MRRILFLTINPMEKEQPYPRHICAEDTTEKRQIQGYLNLDCRVEFYVLGEKLRQKRGYVSFTIDGLVYSVLLVFINGILK
jgi:hypothetical protein